MPKNSHGYPIADLQYVGGIGVNGIYKIDSPASKNMSSNIYVANYFDIDSAKNYRLNSTSNATGLVTADLPPAFALKANKFLGSTGGTTSFGSGTGAGATALAIPGSSPALHAIGLSLGVNTGNPYYEYNCLDRDRELIARIRVLVRSWDTKSQFGVATSYTPNYLEEGGVGTTAPFHDRLVWGDLFFNYTDNTGTSVRKSWANSAGTASCSQQVPSSSGSYTSTTLPCQTDNLSYLDGFPLDFQ